MEIEKFTFDPKNINVGDIRALFAMTQHKFDPDDMAYLFATGKSELEIRNVLSLHVHNSLERSQYALREWKRHDFAVIDDTGSPILIIEGKVWTHSDVVNPRKLKKGNKSIKAALEADLKKLIAAKDKYPDVNCFITMIIFTVDVSSRTTTAKTGDLVKYESTHRSGIKKYGDLGGLTMEAGSKIRDLLNEYGEWLYIRMWTGSYHGMRVESELLILEPDFDKINKLFSKKKRG